MAQTCHAGNAGPTMALIDIENIVNTCSGIEDSMNSIPHSYIFVPSNKQWPELFNEHMIELMSIEGEVFLQNLIDNEDTNNANVNNNHSNEFDVDEEEDEEDDLTVMSY